MRIVPKRLPVPSRVPCWPLGWGLIVAWGICMLFHDSFASQVLETRLFWTVSAGISSIALGLFARFPGLLVLGGRARGAVVLFAGACMSVATLLLMLPVPFGLGAKGLLVGVCGVADSALVVVWGLAYARLDPDAVERCAALSVVPIALLYLVLTGCGGAVVGTLAVLLPVASALLLFKGARDLDGLPSGEGGTGRACPVGPKPSGGGLVRTGVGAMAFSAAVALLWTGERMRFDGPGNAMYNASGSVGTMLAGCVVVVCAAHARRLNLVTFYRLVCPLLFAGLFFSSLSRPLGSLVAFGDAMLCQVLLGLAVLIHFAEASRADERDGVAHVAWGQFCLQAGLLGGYLLPLGLEGSLIDAHPIRCFPFVLGLCTVLVVVLLVATATPGEGPAAEGSGEDLPRGGFDARCDAVALQFALTPREREVMGLLAQGYSLPYIRNSLGISKSTAGTHAAHIYRKCGVHSRDELMELVRGPEDHPPHGQEA